MTESPRGGATQAPRISVLGADALLVTCAVIWGATFVAQKVATEHMGPVLFNGVRYAAGALLVLPLAIRGWRKVQEPAVRRATRKSALIGGLVAGLAMFIASTTQQIGMHGTSVSNAGFITSLYVLFVPIIGIAVGQKVRAQVWVGVALAVAGLVLLSAYDPERGFIHMSTGDLWVLACALSWAVHVQVIGWAARVADPFVISTVQFIVTGVLGLATAACVSWMYPDQEWGAREAFQWAALQESLVPLAFAAVLSTGLAFTLQVIAQTSAPPSHAAIILSLESVFAAIAEAVYLAFGWSLGSPMTTYKAIGCALMFAGVVVSQLRLSFAAPWPSKSRT